MASQTIIIDSLGKELKIMRKQMGWTQEQLEEKSGVNALTIARIENEEIVPENATAFKILSAFDLKYKIRFALEDIERNLFDQIPKKKRKF